MIQTESKIFLDDLAKWPRNNFERRFSTFSLSLQLCHYLSKEELNILYDATLLAAVCSLALNDVGDCPAQRHNLEFRRRSLERSFMMAREALFRTPGWKALPELKKQAVQSQCLDVFVKESNLLTQR